MGGDGLRDRAVPRSILIVDDDRSTAQDLKRFLEAEYDCVLAYDAAEAVAAVRSHEFVAALVDLDLGSGLTGFDVIERLREVDRRTAMIIVTGDDTRQSLERASELEVDDYIHKSVGAEELRRAIRRSLILRRVTERVRRLEEEQAGDGSELVAVSAPMRAVAKEAELAARHRAPVLITGPVGAGKMVVARRIHALGRPGKRFERLHCATLTDDLADSQLFGYEPGAHSTAKARFIGAFERAEDGTLLLDDIDQLPVRVQAKLLQPLEERIIRRLPGSVEVAVRCRVIATTNKDLARLVGQGLFQPDLLDRLSGAQTIRVPGIEERREDLAGLVRAFVRRAADEMGRRAPEIGDELLAAIQARSWKSVRELGHAVQCAVGTCTGERLDPSWLPAIGGGTSVTSAAAEHAGGAQVVHLEGPLESILERTRLAAVKRALAECGSDKKAAAARLNITVQWLNAILRGGE